MAMIAGFILGAAAVLLVEAIGIYFLCRHVDRHSHGPRPISETWTK